MHKKNQIFLQKLKNNKLVINFKESTRDPEKYIKEVIEPFRKMIQKKNLKIKI
jgi:hypothetical protein